MVSLAGVIDYLFQSGSRVVFNPIRPTQRADRRRYVSHNYNAETQVHSERGLAVTFGATAQWTLSPGCPDLHAFSWSCGCPQSGLSQVHTQK
jgi:hypothetical protein